jgi:hypothetical protein
MNVTERIRLQDPSFRAELPVRHAGRSSAFGGRI